jgi:hypothetical protein
LTAASTPSDVSAYRGRGRSMFYRGRGTRGGWPRARGGGVMRSYKLDNRTTKLLLKEVPLGTKESLRAYFEVGFSCMQKNKKKKKEKKSRKKSKRRGRLKKD